MSTHTATVTREGRWWIITIPALDVITQARRVADIDQAAREAVAVTAGEKLDDVDVDVRFAPVEGVDIARKVASIAKHRRTATAEDTAAHTETEQLVRELTARGVTVRDIGQLLGLTHQRVQQIAQASR